MVTNCDGVLHRTRGNLDGLHNESHAKHAMMTVTTADSKYSRQTVFGGPFGFAGAGGGFFELPLRLNIRENGKCWLRLLFPFRTCSPCR
jgi:hypothetical protein